MTDAIGDFDWPQERAGLERESGKWWVFLALGVVSAVVGVVLMFDVVAAARTLALLVALGLVVTGAGELMTAGRYRSTLGLVAGGALMAGGVLAALWPGITLWVLAVIVGIGLIASGVGRGHDPGARPAARHPDALVRHRGDHVRAGAAPRAHRPLSGAVSRLGAARPRRRGRGPRVPGPRPPAR